MYQQARHRRDQDISLKLSKGARLAVRATETEIALTMARPNRPLGDREERTFKLAGQVPPTARRIPPVGQATREVDGKLFYLVGYVWREQP